MDCICAVTKKSRRRPHIIIIIPEGKIAKASLLYFRNVGEQEFFTMKVTHAPTFPEYTK